MKYIAIGDKYKEKFDISLKNNGILPFWLSKNTNIDSRLAYHVDLSLFVYNKNAILAPHLLEESEFVNFLTNRGFAIKEAISKQSREYPCDINLCAAIIGERIIHNNKYTDDSIKKLIPDCINVNQGYARCTTLVIDSNSIITADNGIAYAAQNAGIDVLQISDSGIELAGYDKGFIGGASFIIEDTVYFTGNINRHPDAAVIKSYIYDHGKKICCLDSGPLIDIGGAVSFE